MLKINVGFNRTPDGGDCSEVNRTQVLGSAHSPTTAAGADHASEPDHHATRDRLSAATALACTAVAIARSARSAGVAHVLNIPSPLKVFLCVEAADMRKGFDTLAAVVREKLQLDPLSGQLFVFRSRRGDRVKLLDWDERAGLEML